MTTPRCHAAPTPPKDTHGQRRASIAQAPLPTEKTVRSRTNLAVQVVRFAAINIRMVKMIRKGHS